MADFPTDVPNRDAARMLSGLRSPRDFARPRSYKKGGKVKKSGLALVHKGERVLAAGQVLAKGRKKKRKPR